MKRIADIPIKRKLTWINLMVSCTTLALVCLALGFYEWGYFREKLARDLSIVAEIVADQSRTSLDFDDADTAREVLASLQAQKHVEWAVIIKADGSAFASYRRDDSGAARVVPAKLLIGHSFTADRLLYGAAISSDGERIGVLHIECGLGELEERMSNYLMIVIAALCAGCIVSLGLSGWLRRIITGPIFHLQDTVRAVASERNYSLRAEKSGDDELGQFIDGFNEMIEQIQSRDAALQRAHNHLEIRVEERTAELNTSNEHLQELLDEHKRTQVDLEAATRQALAASEAKSNFLASMSHEIRTPINGLMGFAKLLHDTPLNRTQKEYVEIINTSGHALLAVINDILDFSKLEAGKLAVSIEPFDMREVAGHAADLLGARAAERGVTLAVSCPDNVRSMAVGDSGRVRQILLNLAGNAVKFTERGHVLIEVREDGDKLRCAIHDTGIGIPAEVLDHLFQKFMQADDSTTRKFGGTGLGLAISKSLVEMMNGDIGVESELGRGSTFWFTVPMAQEPVQRRNVPPQIPANTRLLIVESDLINAQVLSEQLQLWEVEHVVAASTDEAVPLLMDENGELAGWTAILLPRSLAAKEDNFTVVLKGFSEAGLKVCTTSEPGQGMDTVLLSGVTVHAVLAAPLGRRDRLWTLLDSLNRDTPAGLDTCCFRRPEEMSRQDGGGLSTALRHTVLVAEDNAVNRKLAARFLEILHCEIDYAANGLEAVDRAAEKSYDVIFMDCHMPECDGYEATRRIRIREREKDLPRTPIVALTANVMSEGRKECKAAGMDDFVSKPVELEDLQAQLERWASDVEPAATDLAA